MAQPDRLQNEECSDLYCSPSVFSGGQITKNEMGRERSMYRAGEMKSAYRVFIVKPEGNR